MKKKIIAIAILALGFLSVGSMTASELPVPSCWPCSDGPNQ